MISLTPTFLKPSTNPKLELCEDEKPEEDIIETQDTYLFIFLVDRSGSMLGKEMDLTK